MMTLVLFVWISVIMVTTFAAVQISEVLVEILIATER